MKAFLCVILFMAVEMSIAVFCGPHSTLIPDPNSCSHFYSCSYRHPTRQSCSGGAVYDARLKQCTYNRNVLDGWKRPLMEKCFWGYVLTCGKQCIAEFQKWTNNYMPDRVFEFIAPTFNESYESVTFLPTQKLVLECFPKSKPKANITWRFNNSTNLTNELQIILVERGEQLIFPGHKSVFNGMYSCYAENVAGNATKLFQVKFKDVPSDFRQWIALLVSILVCLFIFPCIIAILWVKLKRTIISKSLKSFAKEDLLDEFIMGNPKLAAIVGKGNEFAYYIPYKHDYYEIPRNNFEIGDGAKNLLGAGEFGMVFKAKYFTEDSTYQYVAVKTMKPTTDVTYFKSLLKELKIMIYIGSHENIVNLIGACTENLVKREIYILMELCLNGSLLSYLKNWQQYSIKTSTENVTLIDERSINAAISDQCITFSMQIANGLMFLKKKHIIHGDLAARNVLLTETLVAKISDFGLSRQLLNYENHIQNKEDRMPWKWLAIESLQNQKFSHESDIWSYGVLLWEIFSLGQTPYPYQIFNEEFIQRLTDGYRLLKPKYSSTFIYNNILLECWKNEPLSRIQINEIMEYFLNNSSDDENDKDYTYTVLEEFPSVCDI